MMMLLHSLTQSIISVVVEKPHSHHTQAYVDETNMRFPACYRAAISL